MVWVIVLLAVIITPTVATTYYLPKISGEDYINDGMKWLSEYRRFAGKSRRLWLSDCSHLYEYD